MTAPSTLDGSLAAARDPLERAQLHQYVLGLAGAGAPEGGER